ncbi:unnamed protein product [Calicophoron daubneyi]
MSCSYQIPYDCTPSFCLSRQNIINVNKSSSVFSLRKRKKSRKMAEHFEYNHIPARLSSIQNLHFKSVLAIHNGLAVVHLARDMITQFAVVDLQINKFLGSFGRQTLTSSPESTLGRISPDGGWCLIKLCTSRNSRVSVLKLYDVRTCELISELLLSSVPTPLPYLSPGDQRSPLLPFQNDNRSLENPLRSYENFRPPRFSMPPAGNSRPTNVENRFQAIAHRSAPVLFAFDPRFTNSRVAITNVSFLDNLDNQSDEEISGVRTSVSLMKLPTWECIVTTRKFKYPSTAPRPSSMPSAQPRSGSSVPSSSVVSSSNRSTPRRRRSSEVNHALDPALAGLNYASPFILSIFYSKDGYLLFVVTTETRVCRCSSIGHHPSPTVPQFPSSDSPDILDDPLYSHGATVSVTDGARLQQQHRELSQRSLTISFSLPSEEITSSDARINDPGTRNNAQNSSSGLLAPTLPGCTTLWLTIFNSDTLVRLRTLRFDRAICPIHTCPTNYIPVMSRCGSRLALITSQYVYQNRSSCSGTVDRTPSTSLRHSVPFVNSDVLRAAQPGYSRRTNHINSNVTPNKRPNASPRLLTASSPALPPVCAVDVIRSELMVTSDLSSSYPQPLPRVHFPDISSSCRQSSERVEEERRYAAVQNGFYQYACSTATTVRQMDVLVVYQLPPPPSLQALIRQRIRQLCRNHELDRLGLPPGLVSYLRFQPTYSCAGSCLSRSNSFTPTIRGDSFDLPI